ncbi:hypothetical protein ASG24_00690 [Methylophilus sp. Leaf414]|nr:hypothetical protein ASG24_00690 [Methylophilus sp. Leaf414]
MQVLPVQQVEQRMVLLAMAQQQMAYPRMVPRQMQLELEQQERAIQASHLRPDRLLIQISQRLRLVKTLIQPQIRVEKI